MKADREERLEETISYNVSNEKKWYVQAIRYLSSITGDAVDFLHTSRAHTMTFSTSGPAQVREEPEKDSIEGFQLLVRRIAEAADEMRGGGV
ncbi:MAG: hypothetical protein ACLR8P_14260 [Clostridium fessum]